MALYRASLAYLRGHRLEDALDFAARAEALANETGDQTMLAGSIVTMGWVRAVSGDLDAAIQAMQTALPIARQSGNPTILGLALHQSGRWRSASLTRPSATSRAWSASPGVGTAGAKCG